MTTPAYYSYPETIADDSAASDTADQYMTVEEVAKRLGLPVGLVLRRVEAGDVPARAVETEDGTTYELRLGDLGIEPDTLDPEVGAGYAYEFDTSPVSGVIEVTGSVEMPRAEFEAAGDTREGSAVVSHDEAIVTEIEAEVVADAEVDIDIETMVPPPVRDGELRRGLELIEAHGGPLADIAGMSIDPRELVAGLLDRWERTLEQRIYAEQRQRFESELVARQSMVKELQMELRTARAEHAAAQAEKDNKLAERERRIADAERELDATRRTASQAQIELQAQQLQASQSQTTRKRPWFFRR